MCDCVAEKCPPSPLPHVLRAEHEVLADALYVCGVARLFEGVVGVLVVEVHGDTGADCGADDGGGGFFGDGFVGGGGAEAPEAGEGVAGCPWGGPEEGSAEG